GIGTQPDPQQAYKWYVVGASEGGTVSARRRDLLSTLFTPDQIAQAQQQASMIWTMSATALVQQPTTTSPATSASVTLDDGRAAFDRGDYQRAIAIWQPLAEQGNSLAQNALGMMYSSGRGVTKDYEEALRWFRLSADQGDPFGEFEMGLAYAGGNGVRQDY